MDSFLIDPSQHPFSPCIDEPQEEDEDEQEHLGEREEAVLEQEGLEENRPRVEENGLHLEDQKEHDHHIIAKIELNPGLTDGLLAAFHGGPFLIVRIMDADKPGESQQEAHKSNGDDQKNRKTDIVSHTDPVVRSPESRVIIPSEFPAFPLLQ
jgi:hypothetical protein